MRGFDATIKTLSWIAYISIAFMTLVTFVDVAGRYFFNKPLTGGVELIELSMAVLGGFAILYTATQRGHISVDFLLIRFPKRARIVVDGIGTLLGFATWGVIGYEVYVSAMVKLKLHEDTNILHIPVTPFECVLALGLLLYCLTELRYFLSLITLEEKQGYSGI